LSAGLPPTPVPQPRWLGVQPHSWKSLPFIRQLTPPGAQCWQLALGVPNRPHDPSQVQPDGPTPPADT
jgi:hypothetical protein